MWIRLSDVIINLDNVSLVQIDKVKKNVMIASRGYDSRMFFHVVDKDITEIDLMNLNNFFKAGTCSIICNMNNIE